MKLSDDVYEFIKEEVIDLFVRYDINCTPISGFELAQKMGIIVIPYSALTAQQLEVALQTSADGFYMEPGNGKEYIYYDDTRGYERSNMTILHEIGHCVLGHNETIASDVAESEANFFAKYAIAPPPLVPRICPTYPSDIQKHFFISYEAASHALDYYNKWLQFGDTDYTSYERALLLQFPVAG